MAARSIPGTHRRLSPGRQSMLLRQTTGCCWGSYQEVDWLQNAEKSAPEGADSPVQVRLPTLALQRQPLPQRRLIHLGFDATIFEGENHGFRSWGACRGGDASGRQHIADNGGAGRRRCNPKKRQPALLTLTCQLLDGTSWRCWQMYECSDKPSSMTAGSDGRPQQSHWGTAVRYLLKVARQSAAASGFQTHANGKRGSRCPTRASVTRTRTFKVPKR